MELNEFLNRIHMVQPAVELLKQLAASESMKENQYLQNKMLYKTNRQEFYEKVKLHKDYRLQFLYYFCRMGAEAYEDYKEREIGDEIFTIPFMTLPCGAKIVFRNMENTGLMNMTGFFVILICRYSAWEGWNLKKRVLHGKFME